MDREMKETLDRLGVTLPKLPEPANSYVPGVAAEDWLYLSGQTPTVDGVLEYRGRCGDAIDIETGKKAARLAAINVLAELEHVAGVEKVVQVVKLTGYVASSDGFVDQPKVVDGASDLIADVFGERGRHARAAVGVASLPGGAPVEVDLVALIRS